MRVCILADIELGGDYLIAVMGSSSVTYFRVEDLEMSV